MKKPYLNYSDRIKHANEGFIKTDEAIEKLRIAAGKAVIQFKLATITMNELKYIAKSFGYKIDKNGNLKITK